MIRVEFSVAKYKNVVLLNIAMQEKAEDKNVSTSGIKQVAKTDADLSSMHRQQLQQATNR